MTTNVVIVSHQSRDCKELAKTTGADHISVDLGEMGCEGNHLQSWAWHEKRPATWSVVIEDDAIALGGDAFRPALAKALTTAPTHVVSLYLGRQRPRQYQTEINKAVKAATEHDACWIVSPRLYHAVAVAIRHEHVASLTKHLERTSLAQDESITEWLATQQLQVSYCWPSMVEHSDMTTLVSHADSQQRTPGRIAWCAHLRHDWNNSKVVIP